VNQSLEPGQGPLAGSFTTMLICKLGAEVIEELRTPKIVQLET